MSEADPYQDAVDGDVGVTGAIQAVITAPVLAIASGLSGLILVLFERFGEIGQVFQSAWDFLSVLIYEGPSQILEAGASETAAELGEFGVMAFVVAVGVVVIAFWIYEASGIEIPIVDALLPWR